MSEEQSKSDDLRGERTGVDGIPDRPAESSVCTDGGRELTECLKVLADRRRRQVLYHLRSRKYAEFDDLVEHVSSWEADEDADEKTCRSVRIDLGHNQLPKLEKAGMISYDRRSGSLRYHYPNLVERLLDFCMSVEMSCPAEE